MIVVRPDQYVGHVLPLEATDKLDSFFSDCLASSRLWLMLYNIMISLAPNQNMVFSMPHQASAPFDGCKRGLFSGRKQ